MEQIVFVCKFFNLSLSRSKVLCTSDPWVKNSVPHLHLTMSDARLRKFQFLLFLFSEWFKKSQVVSKSCARHGARFVGLYKHYASLVTPRNMEKQILK